MKINPAKLLYNVAFFLVLGAFSCQSKLIQKQDSNSQQLELSDESAQERLENSRTSEIDLGKSEGKEGTLVGVYFMPSWNTSPDPNKDIDSFWSCITGREDCSHLKNPAIWGPKGRIYNNRYPYEGPFLDRKPHPSLKGFYKRTDPEVAKKQLEYMKNYGIDFFAYNWFFGRHYFHHRNFAPQANIYYPKGWKIDPERDGRVAVPGLEEWNDQLTVLLQENEKLPAAKQMKWAINWCDDSDERWRLWLDIGSPASLAAKRNYLGEKPDKALYLQVHDKITQLWIDKYFGRTDYLKDENGRPIVYIYFPQDMESRAAFYGISMQELLDRSKDRARKNGLKGIKFIAVASGPMLPIEKQYGLPTKWIPNNPTRPWEGGTYTDKLLLQDYVPSFKEMGFEGMTGYVYHNYYEQDNKSYADMRATYRGHWDKWSKFYARDPAFDYQVPVAMGWDMRPVGGTWPQPSGFPSEPIKDRVHSTKTTFKAKLQEAKNLSDKYKNSNGNVIMVCCWNEYLEGNYIEPTVGHGFDYLEAIREVFSKKK